MNNPKLFQNADVNTPVQGTANTSLTRRVSFELLESCSLSISVFASFVWREIYPIALSHLRGQPTLPYL